jgi:hypothetical protein
MLSKSSTNYQSRFSVSPLALENERIRDKCSPRVLMVVLAVVAQQFQALPSQAVNSTVVQAAFRVAHMPK